MLVAEHCNLKILSIALILKYWKFLEAIQEVMNDSPGPDFTK